MFLANLSGNYSITEFKRCLDTYRILELQVLGGRYTVKVSVFVTCDVENN